jgi:hypothetical protein
LANFCPFCCPSPVGAATPAAHHSLGLQIG